MNPLDLNNDHAFVRWAETKREAYARRQSASFTPIIEIEADGCLSPETREQIKQHLLDYNFVIYRLAGASEDHLATVKRLSAELGLKEPDKNLCAAEDRITRLTVTDHGRAHTYIPYTNRAIGWHTDGYYNPWHQRVLSFILHCQQPAASGGENQLLDPDMVYIHLREINPAYIRALSDREVMCIPANYEAGELIRPQTCSAVFIEEQDHALAMRFSKRMRNIIWKEDTLTREALDCLFQYLESDTPYTISYRLHAGEGVINNNVLHTRSAFEDDAGHKRIYYRARFYSRINIH